jgi:hypothetical protein
VRRRGIVALPAALSRDTGDVVGGVVDDVDADVVDDMLDVFDVGDASSPSSHTTPDSASYCDTHRAHTRH